MALITAEHFRTLFPFIISEDILDARLNLSIASASRRLKTWIGADAYEAFEAIDDEDNDEDKQTLQNAEGHLALHFALIGLNTNLSLKGLVLSEQAEGNTVNTYFSPDKVKDFVNQYLEMAREIAEPFLISDGTPGYGFEVVSEE